MIIIPTPESVQRGFLGASSERSWQSNSPSHCHFFWLRQRPLAQRNSSGPHVGYSTPEQRACLLLTQIITFAHNLFCGQNFPLSLPAGFFQDHNHTHTLTTFWGFIWAIGAVDVMIAHKVLGDTLSVLAHELILNITSAVGVHWKWKRTRCG